MRGRVFFFVWAAAAVAIDACGNTAFTSGNGDDAGDSDGATEDGNAADSPNDAPINKNPNVLATGEDNPQDLVLHDGVLFWTTFSEAAALGAVRRMNADGTGTVTTVARGTHANRIAVDDTQVYWTDNAIPDMTNSFVGIAPLTGGGGPTISGTTEPAGIAVDSNFLYVQFAGEGEIVNYSKDGVFQLGITSNTLKVPISLVADDIGVSWTDLGTTLGSGQVATALPDGSLLGVATNADEPWGLAAAGSQLFVALTGPDSGASAGAIATMDRDGSVLTDLTSNETAPYFITVDATYVYWTDEGLAPNHLDGSVRRMKRNGGVPISLATGQRRPHGIAVDANYIYWVNYDGGQVMRAPLPP